MTCRNESGKLPIVMIIAIVLVLSLGAGVFTFFKISMKPKGKGAGKEVKHAETSMWKLDDFVVNLADRDESRYLKVSLVLEVEGKPKGGGEGAEGQSPEDAKARDAIISVLTTKRVAELVTASGKLQLKSDIRTALNSVLQDTEVANIYFTSFAMQ